MLSSTLIVCLITISMMCVINSTSIPRTLHQQIGTREMRRKVGEMPLAAVLPGAGGPVTGTLTIGVMNGISLYSNLLLARFALSWFPQLLTQFPILRPINTVTEPYLRVFRQVIPPIGGFDISAIPALFILDICSQTAAAVGAEVPIHLKEELEKSSTNILSKQSNQYAAYITPLFARR